MKKYLILFSWTLIMYYGDYNTSFTVPGFSSYDNCVKGGQQFWSYSRAKFTHPLMACIEVR